MFEDVKTPVYIIDKDALEENLKILNNVSQRTGCKILLAQKAYSNYITYPLIKKYINGTTASSLHEAKLGYEEMGGETHIFAPAYLDEEFD
ncbi:MAG: carboxynorspermidine decarboxylase, partial [Oscillospiraceae bacterium]